MRLLQICCFAVATPVAHALVLKAGLTVSEVPLDLQEEGARIFGSLEGLRAFVSALSDPQHVRASGADLQLVASKDDTTIARLKREMRVDEYGVQGLRAENGGIVVDVGSNIGDVSIAAALSHPQMKVLALEPVPSTYFINRLNMRLNGVQELAEADFGVPGKPGLLLLNRALSHDGQNTSIVYGTNSSQDAVTGVPTIGDHLEEIGWRKQQISTIKFPEWLTARNLTAVELLKMDCEGCEFRVIPSMEGFFENKANIKKFTAEIHQSVFNRSIDDVRAAPRPSFRDTQITNELLQKRGCKIWTWKVSC